MTTTEQATKHWTVDIAIVEESGERSTHAEAHLTTSEDTHIRAVGDAHRDPRDPEIPAIGDELAAARALAALARKLEGVAQEDIGRLTEPKPYDSAW